MAISASLVKELRTKTGAGMMDCKKALTETNGDVEKAIEYLRKQGMMAANKKADRIAAEGIVASYVSEDGKLAALVEVNCETDFVAKNDEFVAFVKEVAKYVADNNPSDVDALLEMEMDGKKIADVVTEKIGKIGEKISIRRFTRYASPEGGFCHSYIHGGGGIGVLVELKASDASKTSESAFVSTINDLAMHTAAAAPQYLKPEEVPAPVVEKELEIYREVLRKEGKKEEMLDKIAQGKLNKFYADTCLLEQPFVKEAKSKIKDVVSDLGKQVGTDVELTRFHRYILGEGIEKRQDNFAEEVMSQVK